MTSDVSKKQDAASATGDKSREAIKTFPQPTSTAQSEDWVMAPKEPTAPMVQAGAHIIWPDGKMPGYVIDDALAIYRAMLSAAPTISPRGRGSEALDKLIADKLREPAFIELDMRIPKAKEPGYLPVVVVGPTAVSDWKVETLTGRVINITGDEYETLSVRDALAAPRWRGEGLGREPTEAMLNAARDWSVEKYRLGIGNEAAEGCWKAMYDASPVSGLEKGGVEALKALTGAWVVHRHGWNYQELERARQLALAALSSAPVSGGEGEEGLSSSRDLSPAADARTSKNARTEQVKP